MTFDEETGRPVFTDAERTEIAEENAKQAAALWPQVEAAEKAKKWDRARQLRNLACDFEDVADAARTSSAALARVY